MAAFPAVERIRFEGAKSRNPLTFPYYHAEEKIEGRTMNDYFRFSIVYRHAFRIRLSDLSAQEKRCGLGMTETCG